MSAPRELEVYTALSTHDKAFKNAMVQLICGEGATVNITKD